MKVDAPIAVISASYSDRNRAVEDFDAVWRVRHDGDFHHTALAVLTPGPSDGLHVERTNNTAKHLEWGGALLGAPLFVLAPETGTELLATVGLSGAGAFIYHFRRNTDPLALAAAGTLLAQAAAGLVVVVVNRRGDLVTPLLANARRSASVDLLWGDLEEELYRDLAAPFDATVRAAS